MEERIVEVGDVVKYVDENGREHNAIVLINHGNTPTSAINVAYVSSDTTKTDSYGRQIERASSVSRKSEYTANGRYYYTD
jgi:plastocyanin